MRLPSGPWLFTPAIRTIFFGPAACPPVGKTIETAARARAIRERDDIRNDPMVAGRWPGNPCQRDRRCRVKGGLLSLAGGGVMSLARQGHDASRLRSWKL